MIFVWVWVHTRDPNPIYTFFLEKAWSQPVLMLDFSIKCLDRKIALRDSMECSPKIFERSYKRKSQKLFHKETVTSVPLLGSSLPNPLRMQEEERDVEDESSWQCGSTFITLLNDRSFDSFSKGRRSMMYERPDLQKVDINNISIFNECKEED